MTAPAARSAGPTGRAAHGPGGRANGCGQDGCGSLFSLSARLSRLVRSAHRSLRSAHRSLRSALVPRCDAHSLSAHGAEPTAVEGPAAVIPHRCAFPDKPLPADSVPTREAAGTAVLAQRMRQGGGSDANLRLRRVHRRRRTVGLLLRTAQLRLVRNPRLSADRSPWLGGGPARSRSERHPAQYRRSARPGRCGTGGRQAHSDAAWTAATWQWATWPSPCRTCAALTTPLTTALP